MDDAPKTSQTPVSPPTPAFTIRTFGPGDMGRIAWRQAVLYRGVYGWGPRIEVIVGEGTTGFLRDYKPGREQCWVAEVDGEMAGSIFLMDGGDDGVTGRLRLLYVEPWARGLGIGGTLVETCVGFAREAGYRAVQLWTHTMLEGARRIYAAHGFRCLETYMQEEFGAPVQSEIWRLELGAD